jgi:acyl-coenzyme A synthetase/AMP-(fatty) acid ligase
MPNQIGRVLDTNRGCVSFRHNAAVHHNGPWSKILSPGGARMTSTITPEALDTLIAQTGLPLSADQKATLLATYPTLQAMIARVTEPMPREAEPGLIFVPEVR